MYLYLYLHVTPNKVQKKYLSLYLLEIGHLVLESFLKVLVLYLSTTKST